MSSKLRIDTRVRSLKNYLEEFEQGAFKVPSFQRDFLWEKDAIVALFESIVNTYPIGSILFWKPLENYSEYLDKDSKIGPFIIKQKESIKSIYILDGFQRLSSLFGCLTNPYKTNLDFDEIEAKKKFSLFYDLEEEKFKYLRLNSPAEIFQIPVYVFINSIDFRQYARKYFDDKNLPGDKIELYYDRADKIGQIFNNYQIASVDINDATIEEAVEIFRRVNERGLTLSKDWIVSALTNKGSFRLGSKIDNLLEELKKYNFDDIKRDVIFQCIQGSFGRIYFDSKIEDLVKRKDFQDVTKKALLSIEKSVEFLYEYLLVLNSKLLPYNSQLIFLTSFFNHLGESKITEKQILTLKKWFWITSYSNYFTIYSLSDVRKAYKKFQEFVEDEDLNPIYNDKEDSKFDVTEFPSKINMGSVRSKSLAIFMINYSMGLQNINLNKIDVDSIEDFMFGSLFSRDQKNNPSENFIPVIEKRKILSDGSVRLDSISTSKKPENYSFLLNENKDNGNLFLPQTLKEIYETDSDKEDEKEARERENRILFLRKSLIISEERTFYKSLGLEDEI